MSFLRKFWLKELMNAVDYYIEDKKNAKELLEFFLKEGVEEGFISEKRANGIRDILYYERKPTELENKINDINPIWERKEANED